MAAVVGCATRDYIRAVLGRRCALLTTCVSLLAGCQPLDRDNPVDPAVGEGAAPTASLSLVAPLPKPLTTIVDSLVARLEGPDMEPVVKSLAYDSPAGPAVLTIGAIAPGRSRTLTVEGYDQTGRLILSGQVSNITIATGDTTRVTLDLRLAVDPGDLEAPADSTAAGDSTAAEG